MFSSSFSFDHHDGDGRASPGDEQQTHLSARTARLLMHTTCLENINLTTMNEHNFIQILSVISHRTFVKD
jgi:hypothetical protein